MSEDNFSEEEEQTIFNLPTTIEEKEEEEKGD